MVTNSVTYKNHVNHEVWICDDPRQIKVIDGITYLHVHKPDSYRKVLMRKDSLQLIRSKNKLL
jgi:hypothetical protein